MTGRALANEVSMLVECVPNFSSGRDEALVLELSERVRSLEGTHLLDAGQDADHNRAVLTFVAPPTRIVDAAMALLTLAIERIDLTEHEGVHPRMGAADVVPFVPLEGVGRGQCVQLAHEFGKRAATELGLPIFYYGDAARVQARASLPTVRRQGIEFWRGSEDPACRPDEGPPAPHPTAGATAVGVRDFLIAYNVELGDCSLEVARRIARRVRQSSGGLPGVRALGLALESRGIFQVSMNLCDHRTTGLARAFEEVERLAGEEGARVLESELIGLAPAAALDETVARRIRLRGFDPDRCVLERRLAAVREER